MTERYARRSRGRGQPDMEARLKERSRIQWRRAERLRRVIEEGDGSGPVDDADSQERD